MNPYLLQAIIIAAGLSGVRAQADPGPHHDIDMYREGHTVTDAPKLPLNLLMRCANMRRMKRCSRRSASSSPRPI